MTSCKKNIEYKNNWQKQPEMYTIISLKHINQQGA
jgi:hypothetical protein